MNSLPDITEMKKMSINKGHQAVRVFKMLPMTTKMKGEQIIKMLPRHTQQGVYDFNSSPFMFVHADKRNKAKEARRRRKVNKAVSSLI